MSADAGHGTRRALADEYRRALTRLLSGAGEAALAQGYELGRRAVTSGLGILDVAAVHHSALEALLEEPGEGRLRKEALGLGSQFLAESLSAFEMNLRAYQASAELLGLSEVRTMENAEVERAHDQLRTILDATTAVIYLKDRDGVFLFVNRQFERVFGVARDEVIERLDFEVLGSTAAGRLSEDDRRVLESGSPRELEEEIEQADGPHTYLALKFPIVDGEGHARALCCVATDITERKREDEALLAAKRSAEAANRELEAFSYSVAHDLRAPLRRISGFCAALAEDCAQDLRPEGRRYLERIESGAGEMAQLIDDLLALAHVSRGSLTLRQVDVSELVSGIVEELRTSAPQRSVDVVVQPEVFAEADTGLLHVALENLLGNAWKFTGRCERARIEFGVLAAEEAPRYFVRDNGVGFDMADAERVFRAFERLAGPEEFPGTGIGLATVQRVVWRHGGQIRAESVPGEGSTFIFTLAPERSD